MSGEQRARDRGWQWLATLPRSVTAHAHRGSDPLAPVRTLLGALGDPHHGLRIIHLAGSKGKGSTALYVEALLRRLGQSTLAFTSPHLVHWTERIRVDGAEVDPADALTALEAVRGAADESGVVPGFFEALTVAALWLAAERGVDWVILEAGVGGRADATNIVTPTVAALTAVELEHTERLGATIEAIAREKAGIIEPGIPIFTPPLPDGPAAIVAEVARARGAEHIPVRATPSAVRATPTEGGALWRRDGDRLSAAGPGWHVHTRLETPGQHNGANAAMALAIVARLGLTSAEGLQRAARALGETALPGRCETLARVPWVVVDGAHTVASAEALAASLGELAPPRLHLLLSVSTSKDPTALLRPLMPWIDSVTTTQADPDYSLDAHRLADLVRSAGGDAPVVALPDCDRAIGAAAADRPGETLVLATGSVYMAGRVRAAFIEPAEPAAS